ncbi:MAG TPA: acyloxyacyl hydrolase [Burkholderiales bacterium]|jgi:hypothetical protein|nr:acyloxyacyl hydrolase [Burkholderiales bacterium]
MLTLRVGLFAMGLCLAASAQSVWAQRAGVIVGNGDDIDLVRFAVRFESAQAKQTWYRPDYWQVAVGSWRVPNDSGSRGNVTEVSATPVFRGTRALGASLDAYAEAGIGIYLLSDTVSNSRTSLPTSFQFGSHVGAGLAFGEHRQFELGLGLQHLSNAGIKQPNGGINFVQVFINWRLGNG